MCLVFPISAQGPGAVDQLWRSQGGVLLQSAALRGMSQTLCPIADNLASVGAHCSRVIVLVLANPLLGINAPSGFSLYFCHARIPFAKSVLLFCLTLFCLFTLYCCCFHHLQLYPSAACCSSSLGFNKRL